MVLMRDWCPKQGEDAIAGRLHDIAVVAMGRIDGSSSSISAVEPFKSAKNAVTVLRSPSIASGAELASAVTLIDDSELLAG